MTELLTTDSTAFLLFKQIKALIIEDFTEQPFKTIDLFKKELINPINYMEGALNE